MFLHSLPRQHTPGHTDVLQVNSQTYSKLLYGLYGDKVLAGRPLGEEIQEGESLDVGVRNDEGGGEEVRNPHIISPGISAHILFISTTSFLTFH